MNKRKLALEVVSNIVGPTNAEMVVDRLIEEGLLIVGYGDGDVDRILVTFSETFGTTKVSKYDRYAANRLSSAYGSKAVCGIIRLLGDSSKEKFVPIVNNVSELENKFVSVLNFLRNKKVEVIDA